MKKLTFISTWLIALALSACNTTTPAPTATPVDISIFQTAAVQTVMANVTQTAQAIPPTDTITPAPSETPLPSETPTPAGTATLTTCNNLEFISDVSVPDGTPMTAGQEFVKTWKVKNTGSCTWTTGYTIVHGWGDKLNSQTTSLTATIQPGETAEVSINLKAPDKAGTYSGYFRLQSNNGYPFGTALSAVIVVP